MYPDRRNCILLPILPSPAEKIKEQSVIWGEGCNPQHVQTLTAALPRHLVSRHPQAPECGIRSDSSSKRWLNHSRGWINKFFQLGYTRIKTGGSILSPLVPHSTCVLHSHIPDRFLRNIFPSWLMISLLEKVNGHRKVNIFFFWLFLEWKSCIFKKFYTQRSDYNFFNCVAQQIFSFAVLHS